jgi:hypothetical protein
MRSHWPPLAPHNIVREPGGRWIDIFRRDGGETGVCEYVNFFTDMLAGLGSEAICMVILMLAIRGIQSRRFGRDSVGVSWRDSKIEDT